MSESTPACNDPFQAHREKDAVLSCPFQGEDIPMILRHADVRAAAKDWKTYSSDAPFRVPIPSEEKFRRMRQLPIETDPPLHTEYRKIVEPFFKRAKNPAVMANIEALISKLIDDALKQDSVEIVSKIALPLQSRALAHLLNLPESEADTWISWGIHVFGDKSGDSDGNALENYIEKQIDRAIKDPGEDFFNALTQAKFQDRPLTREEMLGFANLTFAGGRDTIIHTVSSIFHHLANHPEALDFLRQDPKRIDLASEEYFRTISPLTHIGRVCPVDTNVHGTQVKANDRISLGWASANRDPSVFDKPEQTQLDRKPNPHIAFGAGTHLCLGAPHARLLVRTLLKKLSEQVDSINILSEQALIENEAVYRRCNGFSSLVAALNPR